MATEYTVREGSCTFSELEPDDGDAVIRRASCYTVLTTSRALFYESEAAFRQGDDPAETLDDVCECAIVDIDEPQQRRRLGVVLRSYTGRAIALRGVAAGGGGESAAALTSGWATVRTPDPRPAKPSTCTCS